jgi:SAM-dependent methyltransferase
VPAEEAGFYDRLWAERPAGLNEDEKARLAEIQRLLDTLPPVRGPILEVGCGTGWLTSALSSRGEVRGVDTSREAIEKARARHPELSFEQIRGGEPLGDAAYGLIVSSEVIEHVEDQAGFLRLLARALRPAGHLVLTTPNARVKPHWEALDPPRQPREDWVSIPLLAKLVRQAGLQPMQTRSFFTEFSRRGRYRLVNSRRLSRLAGILARPDAVLGLAERLGWGLYLSLLARRPD